MSEKLIGAAVIGQSGGPTSVINASAYGVIRTALDAEEITNVYGMAHGIKGMLADQLYDMSQEDPAELEPIKSPIPTSTIRIISAFLRSSRSTISVTSSTTAVTIPWIPATRLAAIWQSPAGTAG